ncbi:hypothetical protein D187_000872 [Cystobacter fuscus DSM 2262]|uniref:Uncharacterized protein n=1 Tax=Cystobacter fuscus (strain ATCC 25194 / DSM 2262 / NBRC 100088 / M29) TaxID=1242864 RepID=S9QIK1_CYSF2|nr:hypothetical protein D187_000872 [Cystobacter fuscus DSM 2262]
MGRLGPGDDPVHIPVFHVQRGGRHAQGDSQPQYEQRPRPPACPAHRLTAPSHAIPAQPPGESFSSLARAWGSGLLAPE